jgi:hypothetical protein
MIKSSIPAMRQWGLLCVLLVAAAAQAQQSPANLYVDVENWVGYGYDVTDLSKLAASPGPLTPATPLNFSTWVLLADVTAINSSPAKGTLVQRTQSLRLTPTPTSGLAIGDVTRQTSVEWAWEFLQPDGTLLAAFTRWACLEAPRLPVLRWLQVEAAGQLSVAPGLS